MGHFQVRKLVVYQTLAGTAPVRNGFFCDSSVIVQWVNSASLFEAIPIITISYRHITAPVFVPLLWKCDYNHSNTSWKPMYNPIISPRISNWCYLPMWLRLAIGTAKRICPPPSKRRCFAPPWRSTRRGHEVAKIQIPSGNWTVCYWKWLFIVDFPMKMAIYSGFSPVYGDLGDGLWLFYPHYSYYKPPRK